MRIRSGNSRDIEFIKQMLIEACFWNPRIPRPDMKEFFKNREIGKLVSGWGRTGDRAVIAEIDRRPSGAAWFRLWTDSDHSYGYVSSDIPELGMGIVPQYRSQRMEKIVKYHHIGIPTDKSFSDEVHLAHLKMYVRGYDNSPYGIWVDQV